MQMKKYLWIFEILIILILLTSNINGVSNPPVYHQEASKEAPTEGSSGGRSYTNLLNVIMGKEELFLIGYVCNKSEFKKNEKIDIEYLIRNTGSKSVKFEELTIKLPKNISFISGTASSNLGLYIDYSKKLNTLTFRPKMGLSSIRNETFINCGFSINSSQSGKYIIKPAILKTSKDGISRFLQSDLISVSILNSNPIVDSLVFGANPLKYGDDLVLDSIIEDPDLNDEIKYTLSSNLEGLLDSSDSRYQTITCSDKHAYNKRWENLTQGIYNYKCILRNLKEGTHIISLKVMDQDGQCTENQVTLYVNKYTSNYVPAFLDVPIAEFYNWILLIFAAIGCISTLSNFNVFKKFADFRVVQPGIRVSLSSGNGSAKRASKIEILVNVEQIDDYNKLVNLNVLRKPEGMRISICSLGQKRIPTFQAIMTIEIAPEVPAGKYILEIEAKGIDGKSDSCAYELTVI
jgi:hypothetical protein